jgi:ArsR family transcriptional regulator
LDQPPSNLQSHDNIKFNMSRRKTEIDDQQISLISKALADPKRFEILQRIAQAEVAPTCSCVRDWTGLAPATVSHHLKELDEAGLINMERRGKFAHITLRRDVLKAYLKRLSAM